MSVVEQKKERIRVALQELDHPTCKISAFVAMSMLHQTVAHDFDDEDSIGDFSGDDDFKEEIFSARVIQVVMDASQDKDEHPPTFYASACAVFYSLCINNTDLATTFVATGGVEFLLERLEAFSSDQYLLSSCFLVQFAVTGSLHDNERARFVDMTLAKLVAAFELNFETQDEQFYLHYCTAVGSSLGPSLQAKTRNKLLNRIVSHVLHGVIKHKHDEDAQEAGRGLLRHLVDEESAKKMIDRAEMLHCEDPECASCA
jgi:hypothetical protein